MDGYFISTEDYPLVQELLARVRGHPRSTPGRPATSPGIDVAHEKAHGTFVARTPAGGIPALNEGATTWLGTGTETTSGTGTEILSDDSPGRADCPVWRVLRESDGTPVLSPVDAYPKEVLNISTTAVPGDEWILVTLGRDGEWYAVWGGGGGVNVCGNPDPLEDLVSGTGAGGDLIERCPVRTDNERGFRDVTDIKFDQTSFQVTPGGECGRDDSDLTGTGTNPDERKVTVRTVGFTGEIQVGAGDPTICDTTCAVAETKRILCVVSGLVYGYYDGRSIEEECADAAT